MLGWMYHGMQRVFYVCVLYMTDISTLDQLASKLDERQQLYQTLLAGVKQSNDLVGQLQAEAARLDDRITEVTQRMAGDNRLGDLSAQVEAKNSKLSGLVKKFTAPSS